MKACVTLFTSAGYLFGDGLELQEIYFYQLIDFLVKL